MAGTFQGMVLNVKANTTRELNLQYRDLNDVDCNLLESVLSANTSVEKIFFSKKSVSPNVAVAIGSALRSNDTIGILQMVGGGKGPESMGIEGAISISYGLEKNESLTSLNLSSNNIQCKGAAALADAIRNNVGCAITELNLSNNEIGPKGAVNLADCLKYNGSVKILNLNRNRIGDAGVLSLCAGLKPNQCVETVDVGENYVGDAGVISLCDMFTEATYCTMHTLNMSNNWIGLAGCQELATALLHPRCRLENFDLRSNRIEEIDARELASVLMDKGRPLNIMF